MTAIGAFQAAVEAVAIDSDDFGGVVNGPRGPEAGVWVIAETSELPTKFVRIVVTDDRGRYVVPDLPKATYEVARRVIGMDFGVDDHANRQRRQLLDRLHHLSGIDLGLAVRPATTG